MVNHFPKANMQRDLKVENLEFFKDARLDLQNPEGQINPTHSVSAGLDYAAIGPEHAFYKDRGRIQYANANDEMALEAFKMLSSKKEFFLHWKHLMVWHMHSKEQVNSPRTK